MWGYNKLAKLYFIGFNLDMRINCIQSYSLYNQNNFNKSLSFEASGKPLTLKYVVEKRSNLLPTRVLESAKKCLLDLSLKTKSLLALHKEIYAPLLECKTLNEVKRLYPEFEDITNEIKFKKPKSIYAKLFMERTENENFALKMLQEIWANLKNKDEIALELGMNSRSSLEWALGQINFVPLSSSYKKLLIASDVEGNKTIADKTRAWNALHPDLMYAHNKKAAQGCKTDKYREAQSKRMKQYDKEHPERREKISKTLKEGWQKCPEVRKAMSEFSKKESSFLKGALCKKTANKKLTEEEKRALAGFYKRFWDSHPELKAVYAEARKGCKG